MQAPQGGQHGFQVRHLHQQMIVIRQQAPGVGGSACLCQRVEQSPTEGMHPLQAVTDDAGVLKTGSREVKQRRTFHEMRGAVPGTLHGLPRLKKRRLILLREFPPAVHEGGEVRVEYVVHASA